MAAKLDPIFDGKQKEIIETEIKARSIWERKWGEMSTREYYENVLREEARKMDLDPNFYFDWVRKNRELSNKKNLDRVKTSPPVPIKSSQMIGWRCSPEYTLEIAGPFYVSDKCTMTMKGREKKEEHDFIVLG